MHYERLQFFVHTIVHHMQFDHIHLYSDAYDNNSDIAHQIDETRHCDIVNPSQIAMT